MPTSLPTSTEQNKASLLRWMNALNERNVSALDKSADELYTADYVLHHPGVRDLPQGPAGVKQWVANVLKSFPDLHTTVEDVIAEGDKVVVRFTVQATDQCVLHGVPPTEKRVTFAGISIVRFVAGKMAEEWELAGGWE